MNGRFAAILAFVSSTLLSGGCGTFENLREATPPKDSCDVSLKTVYGGVRSDCSYLAEWANPKGPEPKYLLLTALDLPFTLIGDTITLPYTLAYETGVFGFTTECYFSAKTESESINPEPSAFQQFP